MNDCKEIHFALIISYWANKGSIECRNIEEIRDYLGKSMAAIAIGDVERRDLCLKRIIYLHREILAECMSKEIDTSIMGNKRNHNMRRSYERVKKSNRFDDLIVGKQYDISVLRTLGSKKYRVILKELREHYIVFEEVSTEHAMHIDLSRIRSIKEVK